MKLKENPLLHLHLAIFFWGFTGVLGKAISLTAPILVGYRMLFTAIILAVIISFRNKWQKIQKADVIKLYGIGILFAIHWIAFYWSIKIAGASIAMICLATASIFTAILYPIFNKITIKKNEILIGLIAFSGVLVMYFFPNESTESNNESNSQLGIILGVIAAILSSIFTILNKPLAQKYEYRNVVFHEMFSGVILLALAAPIYYMMNPEVNWIPIGWDYLWIFCLVYFCTVLGQSLVIQSLQKLSPFTVTLSVNIEPIYGIILAFLIFQENKLLGWSFYVGVCIILLSLILQIKSQRNSK